MHLIILMSNNSCKQEIAMLPKECRMESIPVGLATCNGWEGLIKCGRFSASRVASTKPSCKNASQKVVISNRPEFQARGPESRNLQCVMRSLLAPSFVEVPFWNVCKTSYGEAIEN